MLLTLSVLQPCGSVQVLDHVFLVLVELITGFSTEHLDGAHMPLKHAETDVPE